MHPDVAFKRCLPVPLVKVHIFNQCGHLVVKILIIESANLFPRHSLVDSFSYNFKVTAVALPPNQFALLSLCNNPLALFCESASLVYVVLDLLFFTHRLLDMCLFSQKLLDGRKGERACTAQYNVKVFHACL